MDELSVTLLDRLIEKTFENMEQEEKLAFVERLFTEMPPASQERFLQRLIQQVSGEETLLASRPALIRLEICDDDLQNIGPWRICCNVMASIDRAAQVDSLNAAVPARIFNALADETRIKLIKMLTGGEMRVDDLTQVLNTAQSTVSHHLRILREAGLVQGEKRGRSIYYSLAHGQSD